MPISVICASDRWFSRTLVRISKIAGISFSSATRMVIVMKNRLFRRKRTANIRGGKAAWRD